MDGRSKGARKVRRVRFKLVDKKSALIELAKLLGHFRERHDLEHTFKPLTAEDLRALSDEQLAEALAGARALAAVRGRGAVTAMELPKTEPRQ